MLLENLFLKLSFDEIIEIGNKHNIDIFCDILIRKDVNLKPLKSYFKLLNKNFYLFSHGYHYNIAINYNNINYGLQSSVIQNILTVTEFLYILKYVKYKISTKNYEFDNFCIKNKFDNINDFELNTEIFKNFMFNKYNVKLFIQLFNRYVFNEYAYIWNKGEL